jgi:hypothetical protein
MDVGKPEVIVRSGFLDNFRIARDLPVIFVRVHSASQLPIKNFKYVDSHAGYFRTTGCDRRPRSSLPGVDLQRVKLVQVFQFVHQGELGGCAEVVLSGQPAAATKVTAARIVRSRTAPEQGELPTKAGRGKQLPTYRD